MPILGICWIFVFVTFCQPVRPSLGRGVPLLCSLSKRLASGLPLVLGVVIYAGLWSLLWLKLWSSVPCCSCLYCLSVWQWEQMRSYLDGFEWLTLSLLDGSHMERRMELPFGETKVVHLKTLVRTFRSTSHIYEGSFPNDDSTGGNIYKTMF